MKRLFVVIALLGICCSIFIGDVAAQAKRRKAPAKKVNKKGGGSQNIKSLPDTTAKVPEPVAPENIPLEKLELSLRRPTAVVNNLIKEKTPLDYEHLREEDQMYKQVLWLNIDTKEKMNQPFRYAAVEDNGDQRFIYILLQAIQNGDVTAFNGVNDRFTKPMTLKEVTAKFIAAPTHHVKIDLVTGLEKDTIYGEDFEPEKKVESYQIKEEIIFDTKTSRLHHRIIGIAPLERSIDQQGNVRGEFPMFWVYYPDLRPTLAKYEAYNPRNAGARTSWEDIFESGHFSGRIVKSTINNIHDKPIEFYLKDPLTRLYEGEKIKEQIFNFEQDQWSY